MPTRSPISATMSLVTFAASSAEQQALTIIFRLIGSKETVSLIELAVTGMITALTVGGKALGKNIALRNSNYIIYKVSVLIKFVIEKIWLFRRKRKAKNDRKK
jgi:hypothetical protein